MQNTKLYYTAPSDEIFEEVKKRAIEIWKERAKEETWDENYLKEKLDRIKDLKNIRDNMMYIIAMFHTLIQNYLISTVSLDAQLAILNRLSTNTTQIRSYWRKL